MSRTYRRPVFGTGRERDESGRDPAAVIRLRRADRVRRAERRGLAERRSGTVRP